MKKKGVSKYTESNIIKKVVKKSRGYRQFITLNEIKQDLKAAFEKEVKKIR